MTSSPLQNNTPRASYLSPTNTSNLSAAVKKMELVYQLPPLSAGTASYAPATSSPAQPSSYPPSDSTATRPATAKDSGYRPLNVKDALQYLDQVKARFGDRPDVYNRFLDIMKDFKSHSIDTPGVIERVSSLFQGYPALISGFNTFLPPGYSIECANDSDDHIRVTTPAGTITTTTGANFSLANASSSTTIQQPPPPHAYYNAPPPFAMPHQQQPLPYFHHHHPEMLQHQQHQHQHQHHHHQQHQQHQQQQHPLPPNASQQQQQHHRSIYQYHHAPHAAHHAPESHAPASTHHSAQPQPQPQHPLHHHQHPSPPFAPPAPSSAGNSSSSQPHRRAPPPSVAPEPKRPAVDFNNAIKYVNKIKNRFSDDPNAYKRFLELLQTYQHEECKIQEVHTHVQQLFYGHDDLLEEFEQFLPEIGSMRGNKRPVSQSSFTPTTKKKKGRKIKSMMMMAVDGDDDDGQPFVRRSGSAQGFDPAHPSVASEEVELFEHIRKHIGNKPSYEVFLKLLNMYNQDILDIDTLMAQIETFLRGKPELVTWLKAIVSYTPKDVVTTTPTRPPHHILPKPDLVHCECVADSPSYRLVPKEWQYQACSGRDEICWEVLNDEYVSHPIWASEDSAFMSAKKNMFEEAMHRCEEERYEYDLNIDANLCTIAVLEPIMAQLETMTLEEKEAMTLEPGLGTMTVSIYERIIKKIYGDDRGMEIIDVLYSSPAVAIPILLKRLKLKDEEWTNYKREANKVWREVDEKNYYKSLDYQGLTFKTTERKTLTTRNLLNEIEAAYAEDEDSSTPKSAAAFAQFVYCMDDSDLFMDISLLIFSYMDHQNGFSKMDRDRVRAFIDVFIPQFFNVDNVIPVEYSHMNHNNSSNGQASSSLSSSADDSIKDDDDTKTTDTMDGNNGGLTPSSDDSAPEARPIKQKQQKQQQQRRRSLPTRSSTRLKHEAQLATVQEPADQPMEDAPVASSDDMAATDAPTTANEVEAEPIASTAANDLQQRINTLTKPTHYHQTQHCLFGNTHFYSFFRLYEILYSRLNKMKRLSERMANDPNTHYQNETAVTLGLRFARFDDIDLSQGHYRALLEQIDRYFDSDVDANTFEEIARFLFTTDAYVLFNVDKVVHAIIKQIQMLTTDDKAMQLLSLFQTHKPTATSPYRPLATYLGQAEEIIGQDEHVFKLQLDHAKHQVAIFLMDQDEAHVYAQDQHDEYTSSFMQWTDKNDTVPQARPSVVLARNIQPTSLQVDDVIVKNDLHYAIHETTLRLSCKPGTEDILYHPRHTATGADKDNVTTNEEESWDASLLKRKWGPEQHKQLERDMRHLLVGGHQ
ncbi:hypothetical protein BC940DRAFT_16381 [Gongronella butleri]|nr:hypothetical protein BC940DRAFT_16381 [Gongronella butleri]